MRRRLPDTAVTQRLRLIVVGAAAVVALALAAALLLQARDRHGATADLPRVAGDFTLTDDRGQQFSWRERGEGPVLVFFGFTHCPDACPTTLLATGQALERLGQPALGIGVLFVSVDPERDTVQAMHEYVAAFGNRVRGLTGSAAQVASAAAAFHIYYEKVPAGDGAYTMAHTASLFVVDRADRLLGIIPAGLRESELTEQISAALQRAGGS